MIKDVLKLATLIFLLLSVGYIGGAYYGLWRGLADGYQEVQKDSVEF